MYVCSGDEINNIVYVSTEELKKGNVNIPLQIYAVSEEWTDPYINFMLFFWKSSDWNVVRFSNVIEYSSSGEEKTYTYSGSTFKSKYKPHMLASLVNRRGVLSYSRPNCNYFVSKNTLDPIFGATLYSDGNGGVYFSATYDETEEDKNNRNFITSTFYPSITSNEDGSVLFEYEYIRQDNFKKDTSIGTIPFYNPDLEAGKAVPAKCDRLLWQDTFGMKVSFLRKSDEFPSVIFDAVVLKATPIGTYTVSMSDETYFNKDYHPSSSAPLTIIVTDNPPVTTTTSDAPTSDKLTEAPKSSSLSKSNTILYKGMTLQLHAYNAGKETHTWKSTDENIASVSENGMITAKSVGSCRIYTVIRGKILVCNVIVKNGMCGDVDMSRNLSLIDDVWLNKYLAGYLHLNQASIYNADCCDDNIININDITALFKYLIPKTDTLPCEV